MPQWEPDQVFPVPINVVNGAYAPLLPGTNVSHIEHDVKKLNSRPPGWGECDGSGKEQEDDQNGLSVTRLYIGPWSQRVIFRAWLKGTNFRNAATQQINRTIPAQDPQYPFLYCTSAEIVAGYGAVGEDPNIQALTAFGSPVANPPLKAVMYFDNCLDGMTAYDADEEDDEANLVGPTGNAMDGKCTIRAVYRTLPYEVRTDDQVYRVGIGQPGYEELTRFVERSYNPAVEALPLAKIAAGGVRTGDASGLLNQLIFVTGPWGFSPNPAPFGTIGSRVFEPGILLLKTMQISWIWRKVPDPPFLAMLALMGSVNQDGFDGAAASLPGYPLLGSQTLLMGQPTWKRIGRDATGAILYDVTVRATWRGPGWNTFPAPDGNFYFATFGGGANGPTVYPVMDWGTIFTTSPAITWQ
jgi:hypothetical protein